MILGLFQSLGYSYMEINPRGVPMTYTIQRKKIRGYALSEASIFETKKNLQKLLEKWELSENQIDFLIDFYINTGFAESCYVMDSVVFSIEKQVNGQAIGFVQIMPDTAIGVIDEVLHDSNDKNYIAKMERICQNSFNMSLKQLRSKIKDNYIKSLNDHEISMFVFFLKFSNRKWRDIPSFPNGNPPNNIKSQAKAWKIAWNTYLGKGTVNKYIERVEECKKLI